MGLIEIYLIIALSTSISCWLLFFWPLLQQAKAAGIDNEFVKYPVLSSIIYIIISTIIAPALIMPLLSNSRGEAFRHGLEKSIFKQD